MSGIPTGFGGIIDRVMAAVFDLSVDVGSAAVSLVLDSPLLVASGTFGNDGFGAGVDASNLAGVGAVVLKTVTRAARAGNAEPRCWPEVFRAGAPFYLNSVGLANPGIEAVVRCVVPCLVCRGVPVVLSIAGGDLYEWEALAVVAGGVEGLAGVELNLSCPNVGGGALFSHDAHLAGAVAALARREVSRLLWAKLAPNVPDVVEVGIAAEAAGVDGLTVGNSMPAMGIDARSGRPVLGGVYGGLTGPALRPVALALVHRLSGVVGVPLIGCGGVSSGRHVAEYLMAGARAVQVGTAVLSEPAAGDWIVRELAAAASELGLLSVGSFQRV